MLRCQSTTRKRRTNLELRERREFVPDFLDTRVVIGFLHFLFEIADLQMFATMRRNLKRRDFAKNAAQQRRFTDPVRTDEGDLLPPFHAQIQRTGQWAIIADDQILSFKNNLAGGPRFLEVELRLRFFLRKLDDVHLVQLLLSGHRHITCRYTGFVACNEVLQFGNFLLLTFEGGLQLRFFISYTCWKCS